MRQSSGGRQKSAGLNRTGLSLADLVLSEMRNEVLTTVQVSKQKAETNSFRKYQNDPVGFVRQVLRENITDDVSRMLESVRDNVVTLARSANGVGKTHGAAKVAAWFYKANSGLGVQVYTAAAPPEENLRTLLWGEIGALIAKNPALFVDDAIKLGSLSVQRVEQEFIKGVTIPQSGDPAARQARFAGKHAPFLLFILDEGDAIPTEVYTAIESCMSGGHARLLILFNPRAQVGPVYQMEKLGRANVVELSAFSHPNVVTGRNIIPGAVTREVTARRISEWTRPLLQGERVDKNVFMVPSFLVGYSSFKLDGKTKHIPISAGFRRIMEPAFSYMVLGQYSPQAENQLIDRDKVLAAQERWKANRTHGRFRAGVANPKMGLDVAELGDDTNVATFRYGSFVEEQELWGGVDTLVTAEKSIELYKRRECEGAYIDSNGLGAGVWPLMRRKGCIAHRIMVQESPTKKAELDGETLGEFYLLRDQGWWSLREWLRTDPFAMLPADDELTDELCAATYSRFRGKIKICDNDVMKSRLNGRSPDKATSLMLTFCPENDDEGASLLESHPY